MFLPASWLCFPLRLSIMWPLNSLTTGLSSLSGSPLMDSLSCSVIKACRSPKDIPLNTFKMKEKLEPSLKKSLYYWNSDSHQSAVTYCAGLLKTEQNLWSNIWAIHKRDVFTGELQTRPRIIQIIQTINCLHKKQLLLLFSNWQWLNLCDSEFISNLIWGGGQFEWKTLK